MKVVWSNSSALAGEVVDSLAKAHRWHPKTIKTLLSRLVKKKALTYDQKGRAYLYKPAVKEADCVRAESEAFLKRVYRGSLIPMLNFFIAQRKLSAEEIKELKSLLKAKSK